MLRGFLSGAVWGLVLSVVVLAGASVLGRIPQKPVVTPSSEVEVPAGSSFNRDAPEGPATLPSTDKDIVATPVPTVAKPALEVPYAANADTAPAAQPQTGALPQKPAPAPNGSDAPGAVMIGSEAPVLPSPQSLAPRAPGADTSPVAPASPAAPAPAAPPVSDQPATTPAQSAPNAPTGRVIADPSAVPNEAANLPPKIILEGNGDTGVIAGVTTNRLPRIGDLSQETPTAPDVKIPSIKAFAAPFENPAAKPEMSIVLLDTKPRMTPAQLAEFPFPVTFAVDPADPDAASTMALYRRAGFEVAMLVSLPKDMTMTDAEVTFEVYKRVLPETVAVMDAKDSAFQSNRALLGEVMAIVKDSGMGLVTYSRGLNTALQIAERQGVPAKPVFRSFDSKGETPIVMRRFLDQAAFRAAQEKGVIMVGHARPETVQTLIEWGVQGRATTVALAPLSVVLSAR